jgi:ubiquinol-cytochrome c reductase cytochrome c subunit
LVKVFAVLLLIQVFRVGGGVAQNNPPAGNPQNGKTVFMKAGCYACHGTVGQGGAGARIAPNPLALAAFTAYVRKGGPNHSVFGGMPAYPPNVLSDSDLADIRAYLATIPTPPPAKTIPLLNE